MMALEQTSLLYMDRHVHAFRLALASPQTSFGVRSRGRNECVTNEPQRTSAGRLDWLLLLMERVSLWCSRFRDSFGCRRHLSDLVSGVLTQIPKRPNFACHDHDDQCLPVGRKLFLTGFATISSWKCTRRQISETTLPIKTYTKLLLSNVFN